METIKGKIEELFQMFEGQIDKVAEEVKDYETLYDVSNTWGKLTTRIYHEWHDLMMSNDLSFKHFASEQNETYLWASNCFCKKCKKAKKLTDKDKEEVQKKQHIKYPISFPKII